MTTGFMRLQAPASRRAGDHGGARASRLAQAPAPEGIA
jgi:hypothetical protein